MKRLYTVTRDLHRYLGLLIAPFLLVFSVRVLFLVHASRSAPNLTLPTNLETLDGRPD